jgi:hypothetical protein
LFKEKRRERRGAALSLQKSRPQRFPEQQHIGCARYSSSPQLLRIANLLKIVPNLKLGCGAPCAFRLSQLNKKKTKNILYLCPTKADFALNLPWNTFLSSLNMASFGSRGSPMPQWKQTLKSLPENQRSPDQTALIQNIHLVEELDPIIFSSYNEILHSNLPRNLVAKNLMKICQLTQLNRTVDALIYYLSEDQAQAVFAPQSFLYNIWILQ